MRVKVVVGTEIEQKHDDRWLPLGCFQRKLTRAEKLYSTYDRELLAIYASIRHFRYLLEGADFVLKTDHKLAFHQKTDKPSHL